MIYALIGPSASGKTTIEGSLNNIGIPRIISYTTRPMRLGETNGVHYHFIDDDYFEKLRSEGFFAETATYREWHYGVSLVGINYEAEDYIVVVTTAGYNELLKSVGKENIVGIYIDVDERKRLIRQLDRGDDVDEVVRRLYNDRDDFAEAKEICDYFVDNNGMLEKSILDVLNIINVTKMPNKVQKG